MPLILVSQFIITIKKRAYVDKAILLGLIFKICHWGTWLCLLILATNLLVILSDSCFFLLFSTCRAYLFTFFGQVIHSFLHLPLTEI